MSSTATRAPAPEIVDFGPFRLKGELGAGGMGAVYRAVHRDSGQRVALKIARSVGEHALESLRREIAGLARLEHPGIVRLVAHGVEAGLPWYAMELLEGETLRDRLRAAAHDVGGAVTQSFVREHAPETEELTSAGPTSGTTNRSIDATSVTASGPPKALLQLFLRLCQTLQFLHGEGFVHRDLKPENVLIRPGEVPVIIDLGVLHRFAGAESRERLEVDRAVAGTLSYVAPEQLRGDPPDARTDLYALGCMLFESVCGRPPFQPRPDASVAWQHRHSPVPRAKSFVPALPDALDALIDRLLAKAPEARPGNADEVALVLEALGAEPSAVLAHPAPKPYLFRAPFCGQEGLVDAVLERARDARAGRGGVVVLTGPSGAGKTRLLMELGGRARDAGLRVVTSECVPSIRADGGGAGLLDVFRGVLVSIADQARVSPDAFPLERVGADLRIVADVQPALAGLLDERRWPAPEKLGAQDASERVQDALVRLLSSWCEGKPTLLAIDDAQWSDDLSLETLLLLGRAFPSDLPLLVVLTRRAEVDSARMDKLATLEGVTELTISPLEPEAIEALARGMTAQSALPSAWTSFFREHAGGSPLFVAEYLRTAVAEGILRRGPGQWQLRETVDSHSDREMLRALGTVDALLLSRVDRLDPHSEVFLQAGAVWGAECDEVGVGEIAGLDPDRALSAATQLLARHVLVEAPEGKLRFAHARLRDAAYERLSAERRRSFHADIAARLDAEGPSSPAEHRALAHHYERSGALERACRHGLTAGERALESGAVHDARADLEAALRVADDAPGEVTLTPLEWGRHYGLLAEALHAIGELDALERCAARGMERLGYLRAPRTRFGWVALALLHLFVRRWGPRPDGDGPRAIVSQTAFLFWQLSWPLLNTNRMLEYLASLVVAGSLAARSGDPDVSASADVSLATAAQQMRLRSAALRLLEGARAQAARARRLDTLLYQQQVESYFWSGELDWARASRVIDRAIERGRAAGSTARLEYLLTISAMVHSEGLDIARSLRDAAAVEGSARAHGHPYLEGVGAMLLGLIASNTGAYADAERSLQRAMVRLDGPTRVVQRANCLAALAAAKLARGDIDGARAAVDEIDATVPKLRAANPLARAIHYQAPWVHLALWEDALRRGVDPRAARRRAERSVALSLSHGRFYRSSRPTALRQEAALAKLQGRPEQARRSIERGLALAKELGMAREEAWLRYDLAAHDEGSRTEHLRAAEALFEGAQCPLLVAMVRRSAD